MMSLRGAILGMAWTLWNVWKWIRCDFVQLQLCESVWKVFILQCPDLAAAVSQPNGA